MRIAIRKEQNGSIYIDKTALNRFSEETLKQPPYNYTFVNVDNDDFDITDFNDDLTFSEEKYKVRKEQGELDELRKQREFECFPIINRGQLWYDNLTEEQVTELNEWYRAWLDVTTTKVIPEKPSWLEQLINI